MTSEGHRETFEPNAGATAQGRATRRAHQRPETSNYYQRQTAEASTPVEHLHPPALTHTIMEGSSSARRERTTRRTITAINRQNVRVPTNHQEASSDGSILFFTFMLLTLIAILSTTVSATLSITIKNVSQQQSILVWLAISVLLLITFSIVLIGLYKKRTKKRNRGIRIARPSNGPFSLQPLSQDLGDSITTWSAGIRSSGLNNGRVRDFGLTGQALSSSLMPTASDSRYQEYELEQNYSLSSVVHAITTEDVQAPLDSFRNANLARMPNNYPSSADEAHSVTLHDVEANDGSESLNEERGPPTPLPGPRLDSAFWNALEEQDRSGNRRNEEVEDVENAGAGTNDPPRTPKSKPSRPVIYNNPFSFSSARPPTFYSTASHDVDERLRTTPSGREEAPGNINDRLFNASIVTQTPLSDPFVESNPGAVNATDNSRRRSRPNCGRRNSRARDAVYFDAVNLYQAPADVTRWASITTPTPELGKRGDPLAKMNQNASHETVARCEESEELLKSKWSTSSSSSSTSESVSIVEIIDWSPTPQSPDTLALLSDPMNEQGQTDKFQSVLKWIGELVDESEFVHHDSLVGLRAKQAEIPRSETVDLFSPALEASQPCVDGDRLHDSVTAPEIPYKTFTKPRPDSPYVDGLSSTPYARRKRAPAKGK